jgi:DDE family transposase
MNKRQIKHTKPIQSLQVRTALLNLLAAQLPLGIEGRDLDDATVWDLLIYASVHGTTIEAACTELETASGNTVREHLNGALDDSRPGVVDLEQRLNQLLETQLPQAFRGQFGRQRYDIAIDLVERPYHGQAQCEPAEVRRGKAKSGTTHFHAYATLALVHDHDRYELALTFVWAKEQMPDVVNRLLLRAKALGLRMQRAYLDKGFCSSALFRFLRRHRIPYVIPVPLRGQALKALCQGRRSYRVRYTFNAESAEAYTTDLVLVCKYSRGRRGKHHVEWLVYAVYGVDLIPPLQIHELYRRRFGIESGYRQIQQVRAWTTSRHPALRLLLMGLALLIFNVYITLRQVCLTVRHFGQRTRRSWLTLKRLALSLARLIETLYEVTPLEQVAQSQFDGLPIS